MNSNHDTKPATESALSMRVAGVFRRSSKKMSHLADHFVECVKVGLIGGMTSPDYRTLSSTRRAYDSVAALERAFRVRNFIPEHLPPAEAARQFLEWELVARREGATRGWLVPAAIKLTEEYLRQFLSRDWHRTSSVIERFFRHVEFEISEADFMSLQVDALETTALVNLMEEDLRFLIGEGVIEGEGNWGTPPEHPAAHPLYTRIRLAE